jgi:hypothetical protein
MADDPEHRPLRGPADFAEELKHKTVEQLREELELPNVDQILKDLQETHGIRIGLSPKMVERAEAIKASGGEVALGWGCTGTDICIVCDHEDFCDTCDTMDWCTSSDTHIKVE